MNSGNNEPTASFKTPLRHYHRIQTERASWDDWVNGPTPTKTEQSAINAQRWVRISTTSFALLLFFGIITSLIIELS